MRTQGPVSFWAAGGILDFWRATYNLLRNIRNLSLTDPKAWDRSLWNLFGSKSLSGEVVTEYTALTNAPVWRAVELVSSTMASLPLDLLQERGESKRKATDYRLYRTMHSQWNPYMNAKRGRETQIAHVLTWGNGYAEIVRNAVDEIVELWPIPPHRVTPKMQDGELVYDIRLEGTAGIVTLPRRKVLHLLGPSYDGFLGYSRIAMARKSIGLGMALESFGASYFGQGTHPGLVVSHPGQLKEPQRLRDALNETYSGLGNANRLMLLEEGMKVEKIGIPPEDSQFLESRQFGVTEVARWFGVPPHKLGDLTRSSFNNIESEDASFIRDRILPDLVDLEQSYDMQLLTDGDRGMYGRGRLYFKHELKGLLRADTAARTAFYTAMLDRGVFDIDEVRALEEMDPLPNGLGKKRFVQQNMTTLEKAGESLPGKPTPALPAPEPEPGNGNGNGNGKQTPARRGAQ